ncbi:hypothetical protein Plhal304r1_c007g0029461 [Plasmopara halstedii]
MNTHADKAKKDLSASPDFQTWSKIIADAFPDKPEERAHIKAILELNTAIVGQSSSFDSWIMGAALLKADLTTSVLPTLRKIFSKEKILLHCVVAESFLVLR